jgi:predicted dehydrogenase
MMTGGSRIGVGIVGTGFAASAHAEALRRVPGVELVAVAGSVSEKAQAFAARWEIARAFGSWREVLEDERVAAVHDCTPNHRHAEINSACLAAGKHLLSEKPLALDSAETGALAAEAEAAGVVAGVCFNYRHFPLVRELKARLDSGTYGRPHFVRGGYLQDWLLHESDWNWRLEAEKGGAARAMGDIGSHWLDLAHYLTGDDVVAVCARLGTLHGERVRPAVAAETFGAARGEGERVPVATEDFGSVLLRLRSGCDAAFTVSQVTPGRKNRLTIDVDTDDASFAWDQEETNRLWIGRRDEPNLELLRDPALLGSEAAPLAHYPGGHQEGWPDALANLVRDFYAAVAERAHAASFATFADAHRTTQVIEAILASHREGRWVDVGARVAA